MKFKIVIKYILLILWMMLIFSFSAQDGNLSGDMSDGIVVKLISIVEKLFNISLSNSEFFATIVLLIRKLAHIFVYFVLGILWMMLLKEYSISMSKQVVYSILFCLLYACSDEIHQLFVSGRSGKLLDVMVDMFGALCSIFIIYFLRSRKSKTV